MGARKADLIVIASFAAGLFISSLEIINPQNCTFDGAVVGVDQFLNGFFCPGHFEAFSESDLVGVKKCLSDVVADHGAV